MYYSVVWKVEIEERKLGKLTRRCRSVKERCTRSLRLLCFKLIALSNSEASKVVNFVLTS